ncbi:hypothetical protein F0344_26490 [Streptomyces finlayi]|uniref:Uncharacterized protein n=1 Tax=Streptomyces finlayi TaxID=67296 RepID=A0A7G7BQQ8_9ACTN|nr:hypothetical protein [Streptomyces finlayi]QNE77673.1 hypothetical protein F0344_26490 [Streptomyces finlayi]
MYDADGGLTLHVRKDRAPGPEQAANRLPAPGGPRTAAVRIQGPKAAVLDGS